MATQLNIKDPVLIERVRELARQKGQPVTATLRALVDSAWDQREAEVAKRYARMKAFTDEVHAAMPEQAKNMSFEALMNCIYDDNEPDGFAR